MAAVAMETNPDPVSPRVSTHLAAGMKVEALLWLLTCADVGCYRLEVSQMFQVRVDLQVDLQ